MSTVPREFICGFHVKTELERFDAMAMVRKRTKHGEQVADESFVRGQSQVLP